MRTSTIMWITIAATIPAISSAYFLYGSGFFYRLFIAVTVAMLTEFILLLPSNKYHQVKNGSAIITGIIISLAMPPLSPWYVVSFASFCAISLAKHCFGGLGKNPFNPAMLGYALAFFTFPAHFHSWIGLDGWDSLFHADAISSPTPLASHRLGQENNVLNMSFAIASTIGGLLLIVLRIVDWRLPLGFLLGASLMTISQTHLSTLLYGGMFFAAFFVITDPVTAAIKPLGRLIYATVTGILAVWLRFNGPHTDSIAFAILAGNMIAPLCDAISSKWKR